MDTERGKVQSQSFRHVECSPLNLRCVDMYLKLSHDASSLIWRNIDPFSQNCTSSADQRHSVLQRNSFNECLHFREWHP